MHYDPRPIDTSGLQLPSELQELVEKLAENAHDIWATQRLSEGWTHGRIRDDAAKTHPNLVAYQELPESEKEYDRMLVVRTLAAVLALGYDIRKR